MLSLVLMLVALMLAGFAVGVDGDGGCSLVTAELEMGMWIGVTA